MRSRFSDDEVDHGHDDDIGCSRIYILAIAPDFFLLLIISLAKEHNFSFITDLGEQAFRKRCNEVNLQVLGFTKCK